MITSVCWHVRRKRKNSRCLGPLSLLVQRILNYIINKFIVTHQYWFLVMLQGQVWLVKAARVSTKEAEKWAAYGGEKQSSGDQNRSRPVLLSQVSKQAIGKKGMNRVVDNRLKVTRIGDTYLRDGLLSCANCHCATRTPSIESNGILISHLESQCVGKEVVADLLNDLLMLCTDCPKKSIYEKKYKCHIICM